jgi:hypothetical protein
MQCCLYWIHEIQTFPGNFPTNHQKVISTNLNDFTIFQNKNIFIDECAFEIKKNVLNTIIGSRGHWANGCPLR